MAGTALIGTPVFDDHGQVSRPTVRESSARARRKWIDLQKNRGAFFRPVLEREAAELYKVRAGLVEMEGPLRRRRSPPTRELRQRNSPWKPR